MADGTHIEWTDATWNVVNGCSVVSPGCTNCYAMRLAGTRLKHHPSRAGLTIDTKAGPVWNGDVRFNEKVLLDPLRWKRPRKIFVCAHGDLFHEKVPVQWLDQVFAVMAAASQHIFQVLTKRPERLREYAYEAMGCGEHWLAHCERSHAPMWPLENVWMGVSAEDQRRADERIPILLDTPAAVRWISAEPLLGPIDLSEWFVCPNWSDEIPMDMTTGLRECCAECDYTGIAGFTGLPILDWVVAGGESGPGARPMHPDWARSLRDQCAAAGVPFLFKQWGAFAPGEIAGEYLDSEKAAKGLSFFDGRWDECWSEPDGHCDDEPDVYPLSKSRAGRVLDGVQHDGYPA